MTTRPLLLGSLLLTASACGSQGTPPTAESAAPAPAAVTVKEAPQEPTPAPGAAPEPAPSAAPAPAPSAAPEPAAAADEYHPEFLSPRNDFECHFTPKGGTGNYMPESGGPELSCDYAGKGKYVRVILGPRGPAKLHTDVLDTSCCGGDYTLPYGSHWALAPFSCDLTKESLQCTRDDDGQGFVIDKKGVRLSKK